jgi:hypothetical protein
VSARSSVDRASGCGPEGRRSDSCRAHQNKQHLHRGVFCLCKVMLQYESQLSTRSDLSEPSKYSVFLDPNLRAFLHRRQAVLEQFLAGLPNSPHQGNNKQLPSRLPHFYRQVQPPAHPRPRSRYSPERRLGTSRPRWPIHIHCSWQILGRPSLE